MSPEVSTPRSERSLGELFSELSREISTLVRQEFHLARTEMGQKASTAGKQVGLIATGGLLAYAGLLGLLAFLVAVLFEAGMALWAATLLVGVVALTIGGVMAWKAMDALRQINLAPQQTIETLKEDKQWAQEQAA
jgi:hypothetical protein